MNVKWFAAHLPSWNEVKDMSQEEGLCARVDFARHTELVFARASTNGAAEMPLLEDACRLIESIAVEAKVSCVVLRAVPGTDFWPTHDASPHAEMMLAAIESSSIPFVGAVHGACFGIGLRLMLACDVNVVSDSARIAASPAAGPAMAAVLAQRIGRTQANWMLMSGAELTGEDAENAGLASVRGSDADFELAIRRAVDHVHAFFASGPSVIRDPDGPDRRP